jgi:hypothetical protein
MVRSQGGGTNEPAGMKPAHRHFLGRATSCNTGMPGVTALLFWLLLWSEVAQWSAAVGHPPTFTASSAIGAAFG